ncbi:glucose-6-phosphate dehydrogenase [Formicincola oecophyllae]|uniref:Glucose-6-phosphate 1-dehydrogenase n=1 Tax=Formicincola oecophyllae TaxID=2558361 RepID=A0A4Y6U9F2_9PROT|nr:glucose-6-phosphate dehydrogenase [Formicincola oecophyllae]QDH13001.1 glucose-6-phosphate dehydrogenase [Formicincola oecophyllae]
MNAPPTTTPSGGNHPTPAGNGPSTAIAPVDVVLFGATGDLAHRKLLPALLRQFKRGQISPQTRIRGAALQDVSLDDYRHSVRKALWRFAPEAAADSSVLEDFINLISYQPINAAQYGADWEALAAFLNQHPQRSRLFYFSTAPRLYETMAANLSKAGLITPQSRVVLEKPIGTNAESAARINNGVGTHFTENQIFRIDHYLGKETVQNILALRFANPMIASVWSSQFIASVEITAAETVGVEERADYYDSTGAARDMLQNHLLQILALVAMDQPTSLEGNAVRDAKVAALKALRPWGEGEELCRQVAAHTVRGQYGPGTVDGKAVPGYVEELGHPSQTETCAIMGAYVDTPRWRNVPFYLRTLKRAHEKCSEIILTFRPDCNSLFKNAATPGQAVAPAPDRLILRLQPDEGISLSLQVRNPEAPHGATGTATLMQLVLSAPYRAPHSDRIADSYEKLLLDAAHGDPALFVRRDEVEAAWAWIEPVLQCWAAENTPPMVTYPAGGAGPGLPVLQP